MYHGQHWLGPILIFSCGMDNTRWVKTRHYNVAWTTLAGSDRGRDPYQSTIVMKCLHDNSFEMTNLYVQQHISKSSLNSNYYKQQFEQLHYYSFLLLFNVHEQSRKKMFSYLLSYLTVTDTYSVMF